jgi:hypothetical protein
MVNEMAAAGRRGGHAVVTRALERGFRRDDRVR